LNAVRDLLLLCFLANRATRDKTDATLNLNFISANAVEPTINAKLARQSILAFDTASLRTL
jgi:hypothetical protein